MAKGLPRSLAGATIGSLGDGDVSDEIIIPEGDDGLEGGTLLEVLQALATRIQALEDAAA